MGRNVLYGDMQGGTERTQGFTGGRGLTGNVNRE